MPSHTGLSILIPIYNHDCRTLITELLRQGRELPHAFELIVMEDGSTLYLPENKASLQGQPEANYLALPSNIGRSAIRNRLTQEARYDWLLFMDCDSRLLSPSFLSEYAHAIATWEKDTSIGAICGGRVYAPRKEVDPRFSLHWSYGVNREPTGSHPDPSRPFLSNNFLARKSLFDVIHFEERLTGYGHEDTLFGIELSRHPFKIHHIANPVLHEGLDDNETFLRKAEESTRNLYLLKTRFLSAEEQKQIRMLKVFGRVERWKLGKATGLLGKWLSPFIKRQLLGSHPCLRLLDFYKLSLLCTETEIPEHRR